MTKFIPGPWKPKRFSLKRDMFAIDAPSQNAIATGIIGKDNASLIAAAPDLFYELQETHAALCIANPDNYVGSKRYLRNKKALAKAEGEEV